MPPLSFMPINLYDHSIRHELQPLVRLPNKAVTHSFTFLHPTLPSSGPTRARSLSYGCCHTPSSFHAKP